MGLLSPFNLVYLLSAGALVLIYLRMRSRPTIEVSSLMLFDEIPAPVASMRWLRVDLFFWLEMLALAALSIAAAGLYLRMPAAPEHFRHHALIFDLGASMDARDGRSTRLDEARRAAFRILSASSAADAFSVIAYGAEAKVVHAPSKRRASIRQAIEALNAQAVHARAAALASALMRAREADTVDLFADRLPPGGLPEAAALGKRLRVHPIGSPAANLAIVSLDSGEVRSSPGHCVVRNFSPRPQLCEIEIDAGGEPVLHTTAMIEPFGQAVLPFGPLNHGGLIYAHILTDDALATDNQRWAYAQGDAAQKALIVSPDPEVRDDMARVLLAVNQNFIITAVGSRQFNPADERGHFALAVMHDFYDPGIKAASRLLIYPPASAHFAIGGSVAESEMRSRADAGVLEQPLTLGASRMISLPRSMEVLAEGAAPGESAPIPLAAFGHDRDGAVGIIAFDLRNHLLLDPDRLDALVLAVDLVKRLVAPEDLQIVSAGSWVSVSADANARVILPDGRQQNFKPGRIGQIRFRALEAGRYVIKAPGRETQVFVNYFDASESDLSAKLRADFSANLHAPAPRLAATRPSEVQPLEGLLVALALLAFLTESAIMLRNVTGWSWRNV